MFKFVVFQKQHICFFKQFKPNYLTIIILIFVVQNEAANNMEHINQDRVRLKQCKYLLKQALDIDEAGKEDGLAIDFYTQAIELSLKVVNKKKVFLQI